MFYYKGSNLKGNFNFVVYLTCHPVNLSKLTAEPRVALVVLHGEVEEVLLESLDRVGLRLHGQRALHLGLLTCNGGEGLKHSPI